MSDRIAIIGATGFLGAVVTRRLESSHPIAIARPTSDLSVLPKSTEVRFGTLDNPTQLPLGDIDTLVYCASMGFGHVPALLAQLEATNVRRAVFISTTAIFTSLPTTSRATRVAAEEAVLQSRLEWTILRPTMIYGTARDRNISRLLRFLRRSPVFPLCGNALWQPVHVEDVADAIVKTLDSPATIGKTYNVPGADPLPFASLVRTAAAAIGRRVFLLPVPLGAAALAARLTGVVTAEQIRRLAEDKAFAYVDAQRDFGYAPRPFAHGVAQEAAELFGSRT